MALKLIRNYRVPGRTQTNVTFCAAQGYRVRAKPGEQEHFCPSVMQQAKYCGLFRETAKEKSWGFAGGADKNLSWGSQAAHEVSWTGEKKGE